MKTEFQASSFKFRSGFTLVELMVVVALIGILIGGVFRLMGAAGENNKRATTIQRMQKLENAITGFHAKYGTYPPVRRHGSPDPYEEEQADGSYTTVGALKADNAWRAACCQPVAFEFPPIGQMDEYIAVQFPGILSPNASPTGFGSDPSWPAVRLFKFGVLSYLLPRLDTIGAFRETTAASGRQPAIELFDTEQWKANNAVTKADLQNASIAKAAAEEEARACARWLPNLKNLVFGGNESVMGLNLSEGEKYGNLISGTPPRQNSATFRQYEGAAGGKHGLVCMTVRDGWNNDFLYYSAPPYQSYRLWSAGPNGQTFPADYPLTRLSKDKEKVAEWISDDIVHAGR